MILHEGSGATVTGAPQTRSHTQPRMRIVATGSHRAQPSSRHAAPDPHPDPAPAALSLTSGPGRRPVPARTWRFQRIALPFIITGLISVCVVTLVSVWLGRFIALEDAVDGAISTTELAATAALAPVLTDGVLDGDPVAIGALDRAVRDRVLNVALVRVKVWDRTGQIVYSDEPRLIGSRFPLGADEEEAVRDMRPVASVSDLSAPENRYEDPAVPLLEVYLPLHTASGAPLLLEAYSHYAGITETTNRTWTRFIPLGVGAMVLLEVLQLPIAVVLSRRLHRARVQREQMLRSSLSAVDDERRRIAGDLHDGVVQDLAGVAFTLGAASRAGRQVAVDPAQLVETADRVRRSVRSLRSLIVEIYPPNLYDEGLPAALSDLTASLVAPPVLATIAIHPQQPALDAPRTELVYRVAQEGLRNAVRHGRPQSITVALAREGALLVLRIADDGVGCDPDRLVVRPGHLGLRALGELAAGQGAALLIESAPGRGTVLRLEIPL